MVILTPHVIYSQGDTDFRDGEPQFGVDGDSRSVQYTTWWTIDRITYRVQEVK